MATRPSQEKRDNDNKVRWPVLAGISLITFLLVGLMLWLKPAVSPTVATTEETSFQRATTGAMPDASQNTESRRRAAQPILNPIVRQADRMAALAASEGMTDEVAKAIHEVASLGDSVVPELEGLIRPDQSSNVREAAARTLAEIGTRKSISVLLEAILTEQNDDQRRALVSALHALNSSAAANELVTTLLKSEDRIAVTTIRDTLARLADEEVTRMIVAAYHEEAGEAWQRSQLLSAVVRLRSPEAVPALHEIVCGDQDFTLASDAAISLGAIGNENAIKALLEAIDQSRSAAFTRVLVESLGAVNNKESSGHLIGLLTESANENLRYAAAAALGNIANEASVNALNTALQTETSQLVSRTISASLTSLSQIGNSSGN